MLCLSLPGTITPRSRRLPRHLPPPSTALLVGGRCAAGLADPAAGQLSPHVGLEGARGDPHRPPAAHRRHDKTILCFVRSASARCGFLLETNLETAAVCKTTASTAIVVVAFPSKQPNQSHTFVQPQHAQHLIDGLGPRPRSCPKVKGGLLPWRLFAWASMLIFNGCAPCTSSSSQQVSCMQSPQHATTPFCSSSG